MNDFTINISKLRLTNEGLANYLQCPISHIPNFRDMCKKEEVARGGGEWLVVTDMGDDYLVPSHFYDE